MGRRDLEEHHPFSRLMFCRFTVCRWRKIAMMIASPTAASAAATVITNTTKTWPAAPYARAKATNVRFTALSISSTHMKMIIAFLRVRTPTTPMVNSTADSASDSASIRVSPATEHNGACNCDEQQHARELEGEQIFVEQRSRH